VEAKPGRGCRAAAAAVSAAADRKERRLVMAAPRGVVGPVDGASA
jgi:hypothetical protein